MDVRPKLLEMLDRTRAEVQVFVDQLTPQERQRAGTVNDWSAKDLVAHLAGWQLRVADRLAELARGEDKSHPEDIDAENALIWSEYSDRGWEEFARTQSEMEEKLPGEKDAK